MSKSTAIEKNIAKLLNYLEEGNLNDILAFESKTHDPIYDQIKSIAHTLLSHTDILNSITNGDFRGEGKWHLTPYSPKDQIGFSISQLLESVSKTARITDDVKIALEEEKSKLIQEDWIKSQYTAIFSKIQGLKTISDLGNILLNEVSYSIGAQIGVLYVKDNPNAKKSQKTAQEEHLKLVATYGAHFKKIKSKIYLGEGIVGQTALDLRPRYISQIPQDFITIESGLGSIQPHSMVVLPLVYENTLYGVIELASLAPFTSIQKRLLEQIAGSIGVIIKNISGNMLTEKLLEEIAKTNNSLASQKQALDYSAIVVETDLQGKITYVNDKFIQISKYSREELMGQDHRILNSRHHPKDFFVNLWKTIARGEVWHDEVKNKAKDGTYYWVDTTVYPVKDEHGKLQKYVAIRFDITDKKRAFEDLQVATDQATSAAKAKTEFLANMSHEIRTPMNAIIGMAELLKETPLNMDQERYVSILNNSGNALLEVINNILDLSKIESGFLTLEEIPFDLEELVYSTTEIMTRIAHKKSLEFVVFIDQKINTKLIGDPSRLRQVFINLLGNSIKFTKKGEIVVSIESVPSKKNVIQVKVSDTGVGIPKDKIQNIFQNFSQADSSTTREYGGTGLGLGISKRIIEAMGGDIQVESEEGKGSTFSFHLSLKIQTNFTPTNLHHAELHQKKVLIVDDNSTNRLILRKNLEAWGMSCVESDNGENAIKTLLNSEESDPFQFVLLDYRMPDMNGMEVAKKMHEVSKRSRATIVMLTSEDKRSEFGRARTLGISSFITKPIRGKDLHHVMLHSIQLIKNQPTVLVVEDEPDLVEIISASIQSLKVNVVTAKNGKEAYETLKEKKVHLVISDVSMPKMNGLQLIEKARSHQMKVPFIFLSANFDQYGSQAFSPYGNLSLIDKPYCNSTLFHLIDQALDQSYPHETSADPISTTLDHKSPLKILVVDDVKDNLDLIQTYLKKFPYTLEFASNGQEAVDKFLGNKFDLILMDVQMPILNGHAAIQQIRRIEEDKSLRSTPILSLSAHAVHEEMQNSMRAGANGYLTKPIKKGMLLEAIEKYTTQPLNKNEDLKKASA